MPFNHNLLDASKIKTASLLDIAQLGLQFGSSIIVAPHPDDEALGCGGLILHLRSQNIPVFVVFITSGGKSHPNSQKYPQEKLEALRESEAIKACGILNIPKENVFFFRQTDGDLSNLNADELQPVINKLKFLCQEYAIKSLFIPWRRDTHPDHIISNLIGTEAVKNAHDAIQIVEYPVWLWNRSNPEDWPKDEETTAFRLNIEEVLQPKREAIFAHKSQTSKFITDDPDGFILTDDLLAPFLAPYEYFFIHKSQKMEALTGHYFKELYQHNPDPWNFKDSAYEHQKYHRVDILLNKRSYENGLELGCSIGIQTPYFAKRCEHLLAVDVSKEAIGKAMSNNESLTNVDFRVTDLMAEFPDGKFDLISMCEMGYYFDEKSLLHIFKNINQHLNKGGDFLMVHWTSFVREYPIHGTDVNRLFQKYNAVKKSFKCQTTYVHDKYELFLWHKYQ